MRYQPRQRPPRLSGFAGHSPPAGGRQVADWDVPGMEKGALFAHPRVIPILSKGGWQATNNRPLEWNAGLRTVPLPLFQVPSASTSTYQPRQRPPRLSGFAGHSPPAGGATSCGLGYPGNGKGCTFCPSQGHPNPHRPLPRRGKGGEATLRQQGGLADVGSKPEAPQIEIPPHTPGHLKPQSKSFLTQGGSGRAKHGR